MRPNRGAYQFKERKTEMRMNLHNVAKIKLSSVESLPTCKTRTLVIEDLNGNKYEITLFADSAEQLAIEI